MQISHASQLVHATNLPHTVDIVKRKSDPAAFLVVLLRNYNVHT